MGRTQIRPLLYFINTAIFLVLGAAILKESALAVTYSPTDESELNTALSGANNGDIIELSASIELVNGITIDDNIEFRGNNYALSGDDSFSDSVITVNSGKTVYFSELAISAGDSLNGGGIYTSGTIYLSEVILNGNDASNFGGGIYGSSNSNITLDRTVVTDNVSGDDGAGVHARGGLTVTNSSFISNTVSDASKYGAGIYVTGVSGGTVNISSSTFYDGSTYFGGGVATEVVGTVNFINNTFYENVNILGGGVHIVPVNGTTNINFTNNTFALNESSGMTSGNDIYYNDTNSSNITNISLKNNIFGSAGTGNIYILNDSSGTTNVTSSYNLSGDNSISGFGGTGDINNTDPEFDAGGLTDNGGEADTLALDSADSPAVDAGTSTGAPLVDQRGELRDSNIDIGAYEYDHVTLPPSVSVPGNNYRDNQVAVSYYLRETPTSGSVRIIFDSENDSNDVTLTMADSVTDEIVEFVIPEDGDLSDIDEIDSATASTLNSDEYTVTVSYQDALGNPAGTSTSTNVIFDTIPPYIVIYNELILNSTSPITTTYINIGEQPSTGDLEVVLTDATTIKYEDFECNDDPGPYDLKCTITITGSGTFTIRATDSLGQVAEVTSPVYTISIPEPTTSTPYNAYSYFITQAAASETIESEDDDEKSDTATLPDSYATENTEDTSVSDDGSYILLENNSNDDQNQSSNVSPIFIIMFLIASVLVSGILVIKRRVE